MTILNTNLISTKKILIVGDAMVDSYITTKPVGISDEAAVMVLDWVDNQRCLGGMLNVAASLKAIGLAVHTIGLRGEDDAGEFLVEETAQLGLQSEWIIDGRPTIEKARVVAGIGSPSDYLARIDTERKDPLIAGDEQQLIHMLENAIKSGVDAVVFSDYAKGLISDKVAQTAISFASSQSIPVIVDAKPTTYARYQGATLIKPNIYEAIKGAQRLGIHLTTDSATSTNSTDDDVILDHLTKDSKPDQKYTKKYIQQLAGKLAHRLDSDIVITCGPSGFLVYPNRDSGNENCDKPQWLDAPVCDKTGNNTLVSTSGAGDCVLAMLTAASVSGQSWSDGIRMSRQVLQNAMMREGTCRVMDEDITI